jgi:hypothetical protein
MAPTSSTEPEVQRITLHQFLKQQHLLQHRLKPAVMWSWAAATGRPAHDDEAAALVHVRVLPPRVQFRAGAGRAHERAPARSRQDPRPPWRGRAEARGSCAGCRRGGASPRRGAGRVRGDVPYTELYCRRRGDHSQQGRAALDAPGAGARARPVPRRERRRGG